MASKCAFTSGLRYTDLESGREVIEDSKGFQTKDFKIKWKLVMALYPDLEFRPVNA
jgi:hypothetical protein